MTLRDAALAYQQAGLAPIPILPATSQGAKRPAIPWGTYKTTQPTRAEVETWWPENNPDGYGIAIICGEPSRNLVMIELEGRAAHHLQTLTTHAHNNGMGGLWDRLASYVESSPSGGIHFYIHLTLAEGEEMPRNTKLARTIDPDTGEIQVLAETRGQGGYSVVAPTPGRFHPTGKPWTVLTGTLTSAPEFTLAEYEQLCAVFSILDEMPVREATVEATHTLLAPHGASRASTSAVPDRVEGVKPGDDFEARTSWEDILSPHGWRIAHRDGDTIYWRRPGKHEGISATTGHANDRDRLYVFTTSTPFTPETPYTKFAAYALLNHAGNHSEAARALAHAGYGTPTTYPRDEAFLHNLEAAHATLYPTREENEKEAGTPAPAPGLEAINETTQYTLTDDGNSLRFIDTYHNHLAWIPELKTWAVWNGHRWDTTQGDPAAMQAARALARTLPESEKTESAHKRRSLSKNGLTAMLTLSTLHPDLIHHYTDFDQTPTLLNTPEGLIDLATGQLTPPTPTSWCLRSTTTHADPAMPTPRWHAFLDQTFTSDTTLIDYLQWLCGLALIGDQRQQILPFFHGTGANGKSVLADLLTTILGTGPAGYATTANPDILLAGANQHHPAEIAALAGARLVIANELEPGQRFSEQRVKLLTGGDTISTRHLYGDFFDLKLQALFIIIGNDLPTVRAGGYSFWRRFHSVPFTYTVPETERDPELKNKLLEEAPGILAWMIQGATRILQGDNYQVPERVLEATREYERDQDTVGQFLDDVCTTGDPNNPHLRTSVADLRHQYEAWCEEYGHKPLGSKSLTQRLRTHGIMTSKASKGTRTYDGVAVINPVDPLYGYFGRR